MTCHPQSTKKVGSPILLYQDSLDDTMREPTPADEPRTLPEISDIVPATKCSYTYVIICGKVAYLASTVQKPSQPDVIICCDNL